MSEYHFGVGSHELTESEQTRRWKIAVEHGAEFTFMRDTNGTPRYWFSCRNLGSPHDQLTERLVMAEMSNHEPRNN